MQLLLRLPRHETPVVWPKWLWAEHTALRRRSLPRRCFPILSAFLWNQKGAGPPPFFFWQLGEGPEGVN